MILAKGRLRVLHVIPHLAAGGAERVVVELIREMEKEEECEVKLVVLSDVDRFPGRFELCEKPVFLGYEGSLWDWRGWRRCVKGLIREIEGWGADLVHSHLWPASRVAGVAARRAGVGHVAHVHDTRSWVGGRSMKDRYQRWLTRRCLQGRAVRYVAVSAAAGEYNTRHLGLNQSQMAVIRNGVDLEYFGLGYNESGEEGVVRIGLAARLNPEKGHRYLLQALAEVVKVEDLDVRLYLAGEGSLKRDLERQVGELGIEGCVEFMGLVRDVPEFLRGVDIVVLPSVGAEGLPMTILEGMAMERAVLATRVAGAPEVIEDGVNGLLVEAGDVGGLAEAITRLARDKSLRERLGKAARATIEKGYSIEGVVASIRGLYRDITG